MTWGEIVPEADPLDLVSPGINTAPGWPVLQEGVQRAALTVQIEAIGKKNGAEAPWKLSDERRRRSKKQKT